MSFLLQGLEALLESEQKLKRPYQEFNHEQQNQRSLKASDKINSLQKTLQNRNQQLIKFWSNQKTTQLYFLLHKLHKDVTYILKATISIRNFELKFQFKPLTQNNSQYIMLSSLQRRIYAQKSIYTLNKLKTKLFNQLKISIDPRIGTIKIDIPIFYNRIKDISQLPKQVKTSINIFQNNLPVLYQSLLTFMQITNYNPNKYAFQLFLRTNSKLKQVQKYTKLANLVVNIGTEDATQYQYYDYSTFIQQKSLRDINKNIILKLQFNSHSLYYLPKQYMFIDGLTVLKQQQLTLDAPDKAKILENLQISQIKVMRESNQRKFVVNHIKLAKPLDQFNCKKIDKCGFSQIYSTQVYYISLDSESHQENPSEIKKKTMIVKTQNVATKKKLKINHQKDILLKLKNAVSIFLPKYYFPVNLGDNQSFLFMQSIGSSFGYCNLEQYITLTKPIISLHSKIYIGLSVLQGLRFLKDYQITHLDLKNSNLMISKKFEIKFIDFGDSYHPSLKSHQPGISMPYSAPENYSKKKDFCFKSDIFSFGVIMYNLLTSRHPFYVYSKKQRENIFSSISQRWYFNPQNLSQYGQANIFPYILLLIGKCLNVDEQLRPQLQWITLIFRQYFTFY